MRNKLAWFKRTLTGYRVVFVNVDHTYTVIHRPFRQPIMKSEKGLNKMRGMSYSQIIFDEYVPAKSKDTK